MKYLIFVFMIVVSCLPVVHAEEAKESKEISETQFLPPKNLYDSPIADPRWPRFSMGLSKDFKGNLGKNKFSFTFGENIGLVQHDYKSGKYELGIQAATFGVMDIHSNPSRLMNADYFIALGVSHSSGNIQQLVQFSHMSSHVGDEYLLSPEGANLQRINLSYETLKWFLRYKKETDRAASNLSPYVAVGYIVHVEPGLTKRLMLEAGLDYFSSRFIFSDTTRFIAGAHVNAWQENNFKGTLNIRAGLQYERTKYCNRYLQLLVEYKKGKSQQGQFYNRNVESVGILLAFSS